FSNKNELPSPITNNSDNIVYNDDNKDANITNINTTIITNQTTQKPSSSSSSSGSGSSGGPEANPYVCTPSCLGKECGDDGCNGVCGTCNLDQTCSQGVCINQTKSNCILDSDCQLEYFCNKEIGNCQKLNCLIENVYFLENEIKEQEISSIIVKGNEECTNRTQVWVEIYKEDQTPAQNSPYMRYLQSPNSRLFTNYNNRSEKWAGELTQQSNEKYYAIAKSMNNNLKSNLIQVVAGYCTDKLSCSDFINEDNCSVSDICSLSCDWYENQCIKHVPKSFYIDPVNGNDLNNGLSSSTAWKNLSLVMSSYIKSSAYKVYPYTSGSEFVIMNKGAPIKAGDTIYLMTGYHDWSNRYKGYNADYITLAKAPNNYPTLNRIYFYASSKWNITGLNISCSFAPSFVKTSMIQTENHGWHGPVYDFIIENNYLSSAPDNSRLSWNESDWSKYACSGIIGISNNFIVQNNHLRNVNFGMSVGGNNIKIKNNIIEHIMGDGMAAGANNILIENNTFKYWYAIDDNHDDGIQFHRGGNIDKIPMENVTERGNYIFGMHLEEFPYSKSPQGLGNFDPPYINWVVENNIIAVDHWHGITVMGCNNCIIRNNLAINPDPNATMTAWISVAGGTRGKENNVTITNCMSKGISGTNLNLSIISKNNMDLDNYNWSDIFVDWKNQDFHLKEGSEAIDAGASVDLFKDYEGNPRPKGYGFDIGPYEYQNTNQGSPDYTSSSLNQMSFFAKIINFFKNLF
ncbi:MAG: choice-of-anchor Q domain-containing protein, partial [Candidatus Nanoarchaeia archaeon]